jgi:hypothetical protein
VRHVQLCLVNWAKNLAPYNMDPQYDLYFEELELPSGVSSNLRLVVNVSYEPRDAQFPTKAYQEYQKQLDQCL